MTTTLREAFEKGTEAFNAHDIDRFADVLADNVVFRAPGGMGREGKAFDGLHIDGDVALEEGTFTGTHNGVLYAPAGDIPSAGRPVAVDYIQVPGFRDDKHVSFNLAKHRAAGIACAVLVVAAGAACGGGGGGAASSTPSGVTRTQPTVPVRSMAQLRSTRLQAAIPVGGAPNAPDWQAEGFGAVWVANSAKNAVQRIDPTTNRVTAVVPIGAQPCDGLATGFGSVWAVDCAGALVRIDPSAGRVVARIAVTAESDEGLIATGEGGVWILSSLNANHDALIRIDPATNKVGTRVLVPVGSTAAAVGFGSVWVTTAAGSSVERVDPSTGKVAATIRVHAGPRFLATGEGAVWVLNQSDGSVSRIDPDTSQVTATILVNVPGEGGCIAAGEGRVWVTMPGTPLSTIDPRNNAVTEQFRGVGGDCISTGFDSIWLSNHDLGNVWRLSPH